MKNSRFILGLSIVGMLSFASCDKSEVTAPQNAGITESINVGKALGGTKPGWKYYINTSGGDFEHDCMPISSNCFATVIVTPNDANVLSTLNNDIESGDFQGVADWFDNSSNSSIFTNLDGDRLELLQNGELTLAKYEKSSTETMYFAVSPDDLEEVNENMIDDKEVVLGLTEYVLRTEAE